MGKWHKHKVIDAVIGELLDKDWKIVEQGHRFRLYCPHGKIWVRVDGTPKNPENHARRMRHEAARCPDRHELGTKPHQGGSL